MRSWIRAAIVLAVAASSGTAQLNAGVYTIDPSKPASSVNFRSFAAVTGTLTFGIRGPVLFQVAGTTFYETVVLGPIPAAAPTRQVTFRGVPGQTVINALGAADALTFRGGVRHVRFENIRVVGATTYGVHLDAIGSNGPHDNEFLNVTVVGPESSVRTASAAYLDYAYANTFTGCVFRAGGTTMGGQHCSMNVFDGCEFDGAQQATYVVEFFNQNDADNVFQNCFIHDPGPTFWGCSFAASNYGNMFWNNTIVVRSTRPAVHLASTGLWSAANSFRNNIVVNLGTGPAIVYGHDRGVLDPNDIDFNCYYAPNASAGAVELWRPTGPFTRGSLRVWQDYLLANPSLIAPGGGTQYDQNSIEANPDLVSLVAPYDLHLRNTSPLIDRGTSTFVAGPWMTFPPNATVATDFEGEARGALIDIGADEYPVTVRAGGNATPGGSVSYALSSPSDGNERYACVSSVTAGVTPIDAQRVIGVGVDPLFLLSVNGLAPSVFSNYSGRLDAAGMGSAALNLPAIPGLIGLRVRTAFATFKLSPFGFLNVSNTATVRIR